MRSLHGAHTHTQQGPGGYVPDHPRTRQGARRRQEPKESEREARETREATRQGIREAGGMQSKPKAGGKGKGACQPQPQKEGGQGSRGKRGGVPQRHTKTARTCHMHGTYARTTAHPAHKQASSIGRLQHTKLATTSLMACHHAATGISFSLPAWWQGRAFARDAESGCPTLRSLACQGPAQRASQVRGTLLAPCRRASCSKY